MSTPTGPVTTVVPEVKPDHVVENVNDHTPDPETPPIVEHIPDPPRPDTDGLAELRNVVGTLATSVASLTELVTKNNKDESPNNVPWTHRGHAVHKDES